MHYADIHSLLFCKSYYTRYPFSKSEEGSKKSESASSDKDLPPEYLNSPLSRESQVLNN